MEERKRASSGTVWWPSINFIPSSNARSSPTVLFPHPHTPITTMLRPVIPLLAELEDEDRVVMIVICASLPHHFPITSPSLPHHFPITSPSLPSPRGQSKYEVRCQVTHLQYIWSNNKHFSIFHFCIFRVRDIHIFGTIYSSSSC